MSDEVDKIDELDEKTVFNMLEFASALTGGGIYPGVLTPLLINQRLKEMNLNPLQGTEDSIANALKTPKDSEVQLQGFSQDFEIQSQPYKRLMSYLGDMLSFDLSYSCINAEKGEYTGKAYQKDFDIVKSFFDHFDYKKEFSIAVREMLRSEAFFACVRFDDDQIVLQEMNSSPLYTMITGRSPHTLLYSFNMYYFMQPGIDIDMFPSFFRQKFGELFDPKTGIMKYNPALSPELRGNSSWVYWQDVPTGTNPFGWCFKFNPEIATRVPYFTGMFSDLAQQSLIRALQKNINMTVAARLVTGEIPLLKDAAAKVKDQFSLTPTTLGNFLAYVKAAIGDALKAVALPLTNVKGLEFSAESDVYPAYLRNLVAMSGINANLIFTNQNRTNAIESQLSVGIDEQLITKLYPQFASFCNYHVNRMTKKFKFKFEFEGTNNYTNRNQRFERVMGMANLGIVLPNRIAAAAGYDPFTFQRELEEAKANGFVDKLTPIISAFQQSGKPGAEGGRPAKSSSKIGDAGAETQATGSNEEKSE